MHGRDVLLELVVPVEGPGAPLGLPEGAADARAVVVRLGVPREFVAPVEVTAADAAPEWRLSRVHASVIPELAVGRARTYHPGFCHGHFRDKQ